ncbi:hypothetical protein BN874_2610005 [Candidatus Contendobacter odensis Run_B_J11]|uniref:Uncharacterized protein n=1 Tax=Candidatus Contendobacter odensis Run_B_J11 TaxID=1400861 RepID=A0A7U7GCE3_9GAMM|nr:hypothetical protein BN874_2610005 [Candidatus Contendobacter odensis Run_B_J11]
MLHPLAGNANPGNYGASAARDRRRPQKTRYRAFPPANPAGQRTLSKIIAGVSIAGLSLLVIPASAGIQKVTEKLDTRIRGYDGFKGLAKVLYSNPVPVVEVARASSCPCCVHSMYSPPPPRGAKQAVVRQHSLPPLRGRVGVGGV